MQHGQVVFGSNEQTRERFQQAEVASAQVGPEQCAQLESRWVIDSRSGRPALRLAWHRCDVVVNLSDARSA